MKIAVKYESFKPAQPQTAVDIVSASLAAKNNADKKTAGDEVESTINPLDTVHVSKEAKKSAKDFQSKLEEMRNEMRTLREELERAREAGEGAAEMWKIEIKCLQIAMRIMSGNKVPIEDERFLMDNKPELYAKAITMRMEKADPKEYDRLSEDEEEEANGNPESTATEPSTGGEPAVESGEEAVPVEGN